jgi:hypothetical protein
MSIVIPPKIGKFVASAPAEIMPHLTALIRALSFVPEYSRDKDYVEAKKFVECLMSQSSERAEKEEKEANRKRYLGKPPQPKKEEPLGELCYLPAFFKDTDVSTTAMYVRWGFVVIRQDGAKLECRMALGWRISQSYITKKYIIFNKENKIVGDFITPADGLQTR